MAHFFFSPNQGVVLSSPACQEEKNRGFHTQAAQKKTQDLHQNQRKFFKIQNVKQKPTKI